MQAPGVVVIGAGVGGLVAAALLAAQGENVTLVEAGSGPGGKVRKDSVGGMAIDAGPTVFTKRAVFDAIFDACGTSLDRHVRLTRADTLARHAWNDARLDLFADAAASQDAVGIFAGAEAARGFARFRADARRVHDCLDHSFMRGSRVGPLGLAMRIATQDPRDLWAMRPFESLWSVLGDYFRDARLRQLFGRYATYCGSSPFLAPSTLMLIAHVEAQGVWFVDGGLSSLATGLETLASANGATMRYNARVARILTENGVTAGVELAGGERLVADRVVLNGDSNALSAGLFGAAAGTPCPASARSLSAMTFLGNVETRGFPLAHHNVFFSDDYAAEFEALSAGRLAPCPTVYLCAQDRRDDDDRTGSERIQIIVNAPADGDTHHYTEREIDLCRTALTATLSRSGLTLSGDLQATTPSDFAARFPATGGALYGRASHGWAASFRRPGARTTIPGLYLAGGSTHPGAGVPMAALSGQSAAACIISDRASTRRSWRVAMPGGISTRSARTATSG